eukprot:GEZU01021886.1.p1 GENE.GEZU01021886.1~~GEZU01021886.1.p1  ORF type:complete len:429 (+),score=97.51 GEZU01021886.1:172-1458(+)
MGYPSDSFVRPNPLLDRLQCIICSDVLQDPVLTNCKHRFCRKCILQSLKQRNTCPICRAEIKNPATELKEDITAFDLINDSNVYCERVNVGCKWEGPLSNLKDHVRGCSYVSIGCEYVKRGCGEKNILRKDLAEHVKVCPFRDVKCDFCGDIIIAKNLEDHHNNKCLEFAIACPNACGAQLKRKQVDSHLRDSCGLAEIDCQFAAHGCTAKMKRKDERAHMQEHIHEHVRLLNATVCRLSLTTAKLEEENRRLTAKCAALEEDNKKLLVAAAGGGGGAIAGGIGVFGKPRVRRKIREMCYRNIKQLMATVPNGAGVYSSRFSAFNREWHFNLNPNGWREEDKGYFSVYLYLVDPKENACPTTNFTISVVNQLDDKKTVSQGPNRHTFDETAGNRGWNKMISHEVFNSDPGFSLNDTLVLRVKLEISAQ